MLESMNELEEYGRTPIAEVREIVIERLKLNFAHANISDTELETRLEKVHEAVSKQELFALVSDLPDMREEGDVSPASGAIAINRGPVDPERAMFSFLSATTRKGVWRPARKNNAVAVMGGIDLDFTHAEMPEGVTELNTFMLMGGLDIKVPKGLNVEVSVFPIMGGVDNKTSGVPAKGGPTLRIKGLAIMGGIDIKEVEGNT